MKPAEQLSAFVRDALAAGHGRDIVKGALLRAGWSESEVEAALFGWTDQGLGLPVPSPRTSFSTAEAVTYAMLFVALLAVSWHVVALGFGLIDMWLPDPDSPMGPWQVTSLRWSVSVLVVVLPLFLWLHHRADRAARDDPGQRRAPLRARFGAITLVLAALVLLGAAIAVVFAVLNGDMTARFAAKAGLVLLVAAIVMAWFRSFLGGAADAP